MNTAQGAAGIPNAGTRAAGLVLWTDDGKILVGRGATTGEWSEPGGKLERGEATRACASRELYEETRLSADDLEIDWEQPLYDMQCKYTFFQRRLGDYRPAPTASNLQISGDGGGDRDLGRDRDLGEEPRRMAVRIRPAGGPAGGGAPPPQEANLLGGCGGAQRSPPARSPSSG